MNGVVSQNFPAHNGLSPLKILGHQVLKKRLQFIGSVVFLEIANFAGIHLKVGQPGVNFAQIVIPGQNIGIAFNLAPVNGVFMMFVVIEAEAGCFDFFDYYRIGIPVDSINSAANG